jgi:hypothetical protein
MPLVVFAEPPGRDKYQVLPQASSAMPSTSSRDIFPTISG